MQMLFWDLQQLTFLEWTDRVSEDITLTVTAPNGNVVSIDQVSPMLDGQFTSVITTGGPLWKQDGFYTVTAHNLMIQNILLQLK